MKQQSIFFKALADETRLRILLLLSNHEELCVCDLEAALAIPQSTVSRHLATLRNADIVDGERRGVWMYYRLKRSDRLRGAVLATLQEHCAHLEQPRRDEESLAGFVKTKTTNTCAP